jgi:CTP synthase (UTP-ammonia lyase)
MFIRSKEMRSKQTSSFRHWLKNLDYVVAVVIFRSIEKLEKGNISKLARSAKVERRSVYNMFKKGSLYFAKLRCKYTLAHVIKLQQ